ncbi:ABC transporter ATP-binding protein [Micromonospora sp. WMMD1082]|uniref:ABC transporter ATP-binding protein n=1 Tax=Micromonospora sp. WMMD1082 TaxID=3016104 RepID=UPI002416B5D3|nr:ABC transporter ATP-binding protein [Micromonospora sp. WMMD1082]MDG4798372.1 ABC transporter ATP-binding protein [Micromonospora sp. WMMD1082]
MQATTTRPGATDSTTNLLSVRGLATHYVTRSRTVRAVDGVSLDLARGETLGLVGESGCGKSNVALSVARLVGRPGRIVGGEVLFEGRDLLRLPIREMRRFQGKEIGFVFQDPMTSLNPLHTVGAQIMESIVRNDGASRAQARERTAELLHKVGIPRPRERMDDYPHQFSGGMRQRVVIAIALACNPKLLLADEPTTALDVTIQAQILELIRALSSELGTAVLLITHDLGIAAGMCDRVSVMYAGRIVETGHVDDIFTSPRMPYTAGLLNSLPRLTDARGERLRTIEGIPPTGSGVGDRCQFAPRCPHRRDACLDAEPALTPRPGVGAAHVARCWGTEPGGWVDAA